MQGKNISIWAEGMV